MHKKSTAWYNLLMSEKNRAASIKRWENISKEDRSKRMSSVATSKWSKLSPEDRRLHSQKMLLAKKNKCQTQEV